MTIRERIESWPDDPECDGTDAAHPAYWRGHDHAVAVLCQKVTEILDGKDDGKGIASEPWEPVRRRLMSMRESADELRVLMAVIGKYPLIAAAVKKALQAEVKR